VWTVPLANLKDREHRKEAFRVPLSARGVEIVRQMQVGRTGRIVFPCQSGDVQLSNMAMLTLLKRMNSGDKKWFDPESGKSITAHGFRSSFRTWSAEVATFPPTIVEEAMGGRARLPTQRRAGAAAAAHDRMGKPLRAARGRQGRHVQEERGG
jgi:integrase